MESHRLFWFFALIVAGLSAGLLYGWVLNPPTASAITPDTLREDYQTDYVLMVAVIYQKDQNVLNAAEQLAALGGEPFRQVQEAILQAQTLGYTRQDIERLAQLSQAFQFWTPEPPSQAFQSTEPAP